MEQGLFCVTNVFKQYLSVVDEHFIRQYKNWDNFLIMQLFVKVFLHVLIDRSGYAPFSEGNFIKKINLPHKKTCFAVIQQKQVYLFDL